MHKLDEISNCFSLKLNKNTFQVNGDYFRAKCHETFCFEMFVYFIEI